LSSSEVKLKKQNLLLDSICVNEKKSKIKHAKTGLSTAEQRLEDNSCDILINLSLKLSTDFVDNCW